MLRINLPVVRNWITVQVLGENVLSDDLISNEKPFLSFVCLYIIYVMRYNCLTLLQLIKNLGTFPRLVSQQSSRPNFHFYRLLTSYEQLLMFAPC